MIASDAVRWHTVAFDQSGTCHRGTGHPTGLGTTPFAAVACHESIAHPVKCGNNHGPRKAHTVSDKTSSHDHGGREATVAGTSAAKVRQDAAPLALAGSTVRTEPDGEPEHLAEAGGGSGGPGGDLLPRSLC